MGKMKDVATDVQDLGYNQVYKLESLIECLKSLQYSEHSIKQVLKQQNLTEATIDYLYLTSFSRKCSNSLKEDGSEYFGI